MATAARAPGKVVIVGGGITGVCVSYYLAQKGVASTIIDAVGICPAASGKAGGFLALDWNDGGPTGPLTRKSFELHEELAAALPFAVDYRRLTCEAVTVTGKSFKARKLANVEWADCGLVGSQAMGDRRTIAQVHPRKLTEALWAEAQRLAGSTLVVDKVVGVEVDEAAAEAAEAAEAGRPPCVRGVRLAGGALVEGVTIVLAMGPWSPAWLDLPPMHGVKYHSLVVQSPRVLSQAVFFQGHTDLEVYPRPDATVYVTGFPDEPAPVDEAPGAVEVRPELAGRLTRAMADVSTELADAPVLLQQACHLPCSPDGAPVIGSVPRVGGAFVATGAGCWGILSGPATGLAMAELIVDGKATSVDLSPFDPSRFG